MPETMIDIYTIIIKRIASHMHSIETGHQTSIDYYNNEEIKVKAQTPGNLPSGFVKADVDTAKALSQNIDGFIKSHAAWRTKFIAYDNTFDPLDLLGRVWPEGWDEDDEYTPSVVTHNDLTVSKYCLQQKRILHAVMGIKQGTKKAKDFYKTEDLEELMKDPQNIPSGFAVSDYDNLDNIALAATNLLYDNAAWRERFWNLDCSSLDDDDLVLLGEKFWRAGGPYLRRSYPK